MRDRILNCALIVLAGTSIVTTTLLVRRELHTVKVPPHEAMTDPRWRQYAAGGIAQGKLEAPITLTVFSDFQCPFCKQLASSVVRLQTKYRDQLRVVYHHFPLSEIHPYAREAALAAECANAKGKFMEMSGALFHNQSKFGLETWSWFARQAGVVDAPWVNRCVADSTFIARLNADIELGNSVPVEGTPTVFLDSLKLSGTPSYEALDRLVSGELKVANSH